MSKNVKAWLEVIVLIAFWISVIGIFVASDWDTLWTILIIITLPICLVAVHKSNKIDIKNLNKSLPKDVKGFIFIKKDISHDNTFKLKKRAYSIFHSRSNLTSNDIPRSSDTLLCINNHKYVTFLKGHENSPKYYLANVNFKPNIDTTKWTTTQGHVQGHAGSTLAGAAVGSLVGAPLVGALIGHSRKRKIKTDTQFHKRQFEFPSVAYLQLVTTDFKHVKEIKLTNVETKAYKLLSDLYMLTNNELKNLESKCNIQN